MQLLQNNISPTFCIGQGIQCLRYAGFREYLRQEISLATSSAPSHIPLSGICEGAELVASGIPCQ